MSNTETQALMIPDRLPIEQVKADVQLLQEVMRQVMQDGTHYGVIPGCGKKPSLLKPGAEKISSTFRLYPEVQILSEVDTAREYTVKVCVRLIHPSVGFCGSGVGACSSLEEKYGWREAVCKEEYESVPETEKRIKWKKNYGKIEKAQQVRTEPKTVMNTVLKMAKKRAYVDAVLSATAASDIFTQDLEDMDMPAPDREQGKASRPRSDAMDATLDHKPAFWARVGAAGIDRAPMVEYVDFVISKTKHTMDSLPKAAVERWDDFEKAFHVWEAKQAKTTTQAQKKDQSQAEPEKSKETASSQASGDGVVCPNDGRDRTAEECAACTDRTGCPEHETGEEKQP